RLFYVGITRTMEKLYIIHAETRRLYSNETFNAVSRFVKEIPEECIQEVRLKAAVTRPVSLQRPATQKSNRQPMYDTGEGTGFRLGQRVRHGLFGEGVILQFEGSGPNAVIQVNFKDTGRK